jgi:type I restriction enzyme S subunit
MRSEGVWEMPAGWDAARLDRLVDIQSGFACSKRNLVPASMGVAHLRPFNVGTDGRVDLSEVYYIPPDFKHNVEDYALEPGHVLFNNTNSVELVGKTALVTEPMPCAFSNHIYRLALKEKVKNRLEPAWLALALRRLWAMGYFAEQCNRWIGQAGFNATKLREVAIPLPSLDEQRRIVARVESLFDRIEEARRLRVAADHDAERLLLATLAEVYPDPENELAAGWHLKRVSEISERPQYGYTQSAQGEPVGPKFLRITDIQEGRVNWDTVPYCRCPSEVIDKYRLQPGDIVFARSGATTGKTFLIEQSPEAIFASYLIRLKVRGNVTPAYIYSFFQSPYYWNQVQPRGAAQPNMNARILSSLKVPIPVDLAEQRRIVEYLDGVKARVAELKRLQAQSAAELERLEGAVLARAFRGEL